MEFEDFSQDFHDLWTSDYGESLKGPADIFDLSYLLTGEQTTNPLTPEVVLNDRLMTEASLGLISQISKISKTPSAPSTLSTPIKYEHSYSLNRDKPSNTKDNQFIDIDDDCFPVVSISEAVGSNPIKEDDKSVIANVDPVSDVRDVDQLSSSDTMSCCDDTDFTDDFSIDDIPLDETDQLSRNESAQSNNNNNNTILINNQMIQNNFRYQLPNGDDMNKPATPDLTCCTNSSLPGFSYCSGSRHIVSNSFKSANHICQSTKKLPLFTVPASDRSFFQSSDQGGSFPPTPPSSSSSDNESICTSPPRTPLYEALSPHYCNPIKKFSLKSSRTPISTPLISSQPKGATGELVLTDEEKRTLISEGYPIPPKLPLTKIEEKSLKKIRRKIKNKISAQESRRKKKEYMDKLESKVESLETENVEYIKRIKLLQKKNSSLLNELKTLQTIVAGDEDRRRSDSDYCL